MNGNSNRTRTDRRRGCAAGLLAALAAAAMLSGGGCVRREEDVHATLIFRDAASGRLVDDCLVLRYELVSKGDEGFGESARMEPRMKRVDLWTADSGVLLDNPGPSVLMLPLGPITHIVTREYGVIVLKEGYTPAVLDYADLVWEERNGTAMVVSLETGPLTYPHRWRVNQALPRIPRKHPLEPRLRMLEKQLKPVLETPAHYP